MADDDFDPKLPRLVVIAVRWNDELREWQHEVDAPGLDPWQTRAYIEEALDSLDAQLVGALDDDDD